MNPKSILQGCCLYDRSLAFGELTSSALASGGHDAFIIKIGYERCEQPVLKATDKKK